MSILNINDLALKLVALDFSDGHMPSNGGPTKTSRALAIIHLAAHDAYAQITKKFKPKLENIPTLPATIDSSEANGAIALLCAGFRAATVLYPDFKTFIDTEAAKVFDTDDGDSSRDLVCKYGEQVADAWIAERMNDGSSAPQLDTLYSPAAGRHRPDPLQPQQQALGRTWGLVTPFVLTSVQTDAFLKAPPELNSPDYAVAFNEVIKDGKNDITETQPCNKVMPGECCKAVVGIFWGYDGANKLGVPPRLYNQVVRAIDEFKTLTHDRQIKMLTAINVAMADAGIASWFWKYQYDLWRPVVGIREADAGWGPNGKGDDNNATKGDPFWLPLGAPNSNPINKPANNGTPNFPAYPSGHATFGAACFNTVAGLLGKKTEEISVNFISDEFNGVTTDNTGTVRPKYNANFTLSKAIEDNNQSRIYLGVHWQFDATGGEEVGTAIAVKVTEAFK